MKLSETTTRLRQLADHMEGLPAVPRDGPIIPYPGTYPGGAVDLRNWLLKIPGCGTIGCIAGHTIALFGDPKLALANSDFVQTARELLGMSNPMSMAGAYLVGSELFYPPQMHSADIDGTTAAQVLRVAADALEADLSTLRRTSRVRDAWHEAVQAQAEREVTS